jgi:predicted GH43/DUF377 family glycosyl hydrolase
MAADKRRFTPITIVLICVYLCASAACGYKEFVLPPPEAGGPRGPFTWSAMPEPVIAREEASDVLNPSVVKYNGEYQNLYSEFDGKVWYTRIAESPDGLAWKKGRPLALPIDGGIAANGSMLDVRGRFYYWYQTGSPPHIALARQGVDPRSVFERGPLGSFDEFAVADPYVIRAGDFYYLYYLGQDSARRQRLGVARSKDGVKWEKLRSNPILELGDVGAFDENGLGEPAVWSSGGSYWMLYTGRDRTEHRRIGLAKSAEGVHWSRERDFKPISGDQPWNSAVMCDPTVLVEGNEVRVWFGGGDVPRPDQNIHGQIGYGVLKQR